MNLPTQGKDEGQPVASLPTIISENSACLEHLLFREEETTHLKDRSSHADLIIGGTASLVHTTSPRTKGRQEIVASHSASTNWSTAVQTLLDQPPSALPQRLVLGGIAFGLAVVAWATLGQIDEVGHAQGRLVPKGQVFKIAPEELGKVANIAVKEGQSVKAGAVLIELDTTLAVSEVQRLEQSLVAFEIEFTQKQALLEKSTLEARTYSQIAEAGFQAQEAAIAQANVKVETTRKLLTQLESENTANQERVGRLRPMLDQGAISQEVVYQAEQSLRNSQSTITQNQGDRQQTSAEVARLKAELVQKQAEGRRTQLESQQQVQQLAVEITQLKAKITETQNLLASAQAKLKQRFLYASTDGVVSSLNIPNVGEVVQPGQTLVEIAPQNAPLILLANLPNPEAGFVKTGMPVQVKLDAYPYQDYGIIPGKVISLSADAKADQQMGSVYQVEVALDRNYVIANQHPISFKAGQTASAEIIIRRRRVADILLDPLKQLQKGGINL